jgi:valyl-tRNA synthetase
MRVFLRRLQKTDGSLFYSHGKRVQNSELLHYSIAESCEKCDCDFFVQDADTLDTWFSSGLWTFSTLGWPNETEDLKNFHPTNWMQMGTELLFFWMARMILFSTYVLDEIPFENAYIHGILRDEHGKKFSKSAGNGIDPIVMIDQYGADALRWGVLSGIAPGNDSRFYTEKIEGARNLVNKLWNIARFMLQNIDVLEIDIQRPLAKTTRTRARRLISLRAASERGGCGDAFRKALAKPLRRRLVGSPGCLGMRRGQSKRRLK